MAHGCCSLQPGNDNDGTSMLSAPHLWDIDAVAVALANDNDVPAMLLAGAPSRAGSSRSHLGVLGGQAGEGL
jgi:hypothetical protein